MSVTDLKVELIKSIACKLVGFGYKVYLAKSKTHGFYTDGKRVVSFEAQWCFTVNFSGNYQPSPTSGTGWAIASHADITGDQARRYLELNAPSWANNRNPVYTTPEQVLKRYGSSSGYELFNGEVQNESY